MDSTPMLRPGLWFALTIACAVAFLHLGTARLWDRDEPRNAQCAREMLDSGNWIVPTFDGQLRAHKPVLLYWCQMICYRWVGDNEWGARMPSAIASILTCLCTYYIGLKLAGPQVAAWSSISLSTMTLFAMASRAATPDALLVLTTTLSIALFVRFALIAKTGESAQIDLQSPSGFQWSLIHGVCGIGMLAKGPIGVLLPWLVIATALLTLENSDNSQSPYWGKERGGPLGYVRVVARTTWHLRPLLGMSIIALVAGPWYVAVSLKTEGQWLREFFLTHHVNRALHPMDGHGGPPILYYLAALLIGSFPWSCFAIPAGLVAHQHWSRATRESSLVKLATCWIFVFVCSFSLATTKLPSYITPCFPAVALLMGCFLAQAMQGQFESRRWLSAGLVVAGMLGLGILVGIGGPIGDRLPSARWLSFAGVLLATAATIGIAANHRGYGPIAIRAFVVGALGVVLLLSCWGPKSVDRDRSDLDQLQALFEKYPEKHWIAAGSIEPSWVFYSRGHIHSGAWVGPSDSMENAGYIERIPSASPKKSYAVSTVVPVFLSSESLRIEVAGRTRVAALP